MRPPICAVCRERFPPTEGGLVSFAETAASRDFRTRAEASPGFSGHPPELEWFCGKHEARARELSDRPVGEALGILRDETRGESDESP